MPFVKMPGVIGQVYVPENAPGQPKKHPCPDCFACQQCSDDRCTVCRAQGATGTNGRHCRRPSPQRKEAGGRDQNP